MNVRDLVRPPGPQQAPTFPAFWASTLSPSLKARSEFPAHFASTKSNSSALPRLFARFQQPFRTAVRPSLASH